MISTYPMGAANIFVFLVIFRPRGLLGPRGAVLCGTLRTQKVVPHLGGGEKHQKLHEMDREFKNININRTSTAPWIFFCSGDILADFRFGPFRPILRVLAHSRRHGWIRTEISSRFD